jgi:hypothetical protein
MESYAEYALMAGVAYQSTQGDINRLPVPTNWEDIPSSHAAMPSGFEAISFQRGNEIVIAFAGTAEAVDWDDNGGLALGVGSDQLRQAAAYYMEIRAANPEAHITLTGHSLGGGLASLIGVFFDEEAVTFDQAPFRASANNDVRNNLLDYLADLGYTSGPAIDALTAFHSDMTANHSGESDIPGIRGEANIRGLYVEGEVLERYLPFKSIGDQTAISHGANNLSSIDLHSQTLLTTFLLNDDFRLMTERHPDLGAMLVDQNLFASSVGSGEQNFLERLVRNQVGMVEEGLQANGMLDRFTRDLKLLAQPGGADSK